MGGLNKQQRVALALYKRVDRVLCMLREAAGYAQKAYRIDQKINRILMRDHAVGHYLAQMKASGKLIIKVR